ncbi:MAG TPA: DUF948 domain-containing protein [Candidatus Dormibacteraeota bacterium]|nr:DUF948 domain-containing protein [Candidatus Dormibacteraeota bacterium]
MLDFLYLAGGVAVLAVALFLCYALLRLARTLAALEETLLVADQAMREVVPEVRDGLGSVNDIAAGVNVALRSAGVGASRLTDAAARSSGQASAALYGVRVGARSLWRSVTGLEQSRGEQPDGR